MTAHQLTPFADLAISNLWSDEYLVTIERRIWRAVLRFHMYYDVTPYDQDILTRLEQTENQIDLESIERRERITRHDLLARLQETIAVAEIPEVLHLGMTSADIVENSYLIRMAKTCEILAYDLPFAHLSGWTSWLPFRGIKGPVGTQQDQLDLLHDPTTVQKLDRFVADEFGFELVANSTGQVMWRSIDLQWSVQLSLGIQQEPWRTLANGYITMVAGYAGETWNEGDVASSSVRRVALPSIAMAASSSLYDLNMKGNNTR